MSCPGCGKPFAVPAAVPAPPTPPPAAVAVTPPTPSGASPASVGSSCRLDIGSATDKGCVRAKNEDCFLVQHLTWSDLDICHETALVVVTDGVGGQAGGDQAARLVIRTVGSAMANVLSSALGGKFQDTSLAGLAKAIDSAIKSANQAVFQKGQTEPALKGMGATVAAVLVWDGHILVGHVGDCRLYHHRDGKLTQVTKDQTLVARMVELGQLTPQEAAVHPDRNVVNQAIGQRPSIYPAAYQLELAPGDTLVVSSDGLSNHVDTRMLSDAIRKTGYSASLLANELVERARQGGGTDNITAVAINGY